MPVTFDLIEVREASSIHLQLFKTVIPAPGSI